MNGYTIAGALVILAWVLLAVMMFITAGMQPSPLTEQQRKVGYGFGGSCLVLAALSLVVTAGTLHP